MHFLESKSKYLEYIAVLFAVFYFAAVAKNQITVYKSDFWVNDDFRNVSFLLKSLRNPNLFKGDFFAQCSKKLAPTGWKAVYYLVAKTNISFILASKIISHFLYFVSVFLVFFIGKKLGGIMAGAFSLIFFLHNPFFLNRMAGALPRAFFIPFVLAVIFFMLNENYKISIFLMFLSSLFYPIAFLFNAVFTAVFLFFANIERKKEIFAWYFIGIMSAVVLMLFSFYSGKAFDLISYNEACKMKEFYKGGRIPILPLRNPFLEVFGYFVSSFERIPEVINYEFPVKIGRFPYLGAVIAMIYVVFGFTVSNKKKGFLKLFIAFLLPCILLYILARLFFFKMYYPYRYLYPLELAGVFAGGIFAKELSKNLKIGLLANIVLLFILFNYTGFKIHPNNGYIKIPFKEYSDLFEKVKKIPANFIIAGNPYLLDNIPLYTGRRIFASYEFTIPFFKTFYKGVKNRNYENIKTYYSETKNEFIRLCLKNNIDYILIFKYDLVKKYAQAGVFMQVEPYKTFIYN